MNNFIYILFFSTLLLTTPVRSEEGKQELISRTISVNFIPERAIFLIEYQDGLVEQYRGLIMPPANKAESGNNAKDWTFGTFVKPHPGNALVAYSIFLRGKQSENALISKTNYESNTIPSYLTSEDLVKEQIGIRNQIYESLKVQYNAQLASLKRLRSDAEVIANLSRIVEIVEEANILKSEIENLDKDLDILRSTFQTVKKLPQPKNLLRRELELTKYSDELIKLVNNVESNEGSRKSLSQSEIRNKLDLIEQTRFEDEEKLRQQLIRLKSRSAPEKQEELPESEKVKNYWEIQ